MDGRLSADVFLEALKSNKVERVIHLENGNICITENDSDILS